ncbi:hypothetical protein EPA93_27730 [Ktedonosporobacter rubrisoli]|uniref:Uncharacterized protein n=1 Tax=Ktedonosporobacter rubrisoli TaxID=2509675 RepID=A0A4P6JW14_KTERU|nr:hypothetical protein [Ktedonosporobacter rubrisoli]QBD79562.1 hypothetical protein EPA93_27730 [Ktedonosporobacter rubrisoli]
MELEDTLENCLLKLEKKHARARVEANEDVLHAQHVQLPVGTFAQTLQRLRAALPQMLQNTAHVLESGHLGKIFVLDYSETEHVFAYTY